MRALFFMMALLLASSIAAQQKDCHIHTVQPGEGIYSISRLYSVKPSQIMAVNPDIGKEMSIKTGQKVCIPKGSAVIPAEQIEEEKRIEQQEKLQTAKHAATNGKNPVKEGNLWIHTVLKGETFYSICKLYGVLAYDMIATNNLPNTIVMENQKLILPYTALIPGTDQSEKPKEVSPIEEMAINAHNEAVEPKKSTNNDKQPVLIIEDVVKNDKKKKNSNESKSKEDDKKKTQEVDLQQPSIPASSTQPAEATTDVESNTKTETYTVQKGDTYYSLTRKFNLGFNDIMKLNDLPSTDIKIGQVLKVNKPTPKPEVVEEKKEDITIPPDAHVIDISKEVAKKAEAKKEKDETKEKKKKEQPSKTKVKQEDIIVEPLPAKEETVVAKKDDTENNITKVQDKPNVSATEVATSDFIKTETPQQPAVEIPASPTEEKQVEVASVTTTQPDIVKHEPVVETKPLLSFSDEYSSIYNKNSSNNNLRIKKQRGVAEYTDAINGNEYLVYFNDAEPGSIIKVTNLMNKQSAYVKVLGSIAKDGNNTEAASVLRVSKKLAQQLKVLDDKFLVEVSKHTKN